MNMNLNVLGINLNLDKAVGQLVDKLSGWAIATIKMLPNLVVGTLLIIIFWILSAYAARLANRLILRFTGYRHIARLMARMTTLAVITLGVILALDALNLDKAVASMLAGIGILGVALGFAAKDLFADFIAGIVLHFEHPFRLGDRIKSGDILGFVESVEFRATIIRGRQGERFTVPNKDILGNAITNYYISGDRRVDLYIGIDYTPDLQQVEDLALEAVRALDPPLRNPDRPVEFFYEEVKDTTVIFRIRFWINEPDQPVFLKARSEAIKAINEAFKAKVVIRPSAVVTLDFGVTGGSTLRDQLEGLTIPLSLPETTQAQNNKSSKMEDKQDKIDANSKTREKKSGKEQDSREE
ncbi:MAG: mechanosensitive ion channel family protein [Desulfobaccales bacterium]